METTPRFTGQVALVTGGTSGIGLAIVRRLRLEGATMAICDFDAAALQCGMGGGGLNDVFLHLDVTDEDEVRAKVGSVVERFGRIDVLVNSAGVTGQTNLKSHEVTFADFDRVLRTNLYGTFLMTKYVLPVMIAQGYGRVLNLASIAGKEGNAGMVAYSSSKAAVIGLTKVQGKEYAETGVTINALAPAVIRTPLVDAMPPAQVKYMTDKIPMKRCGTLDEVAAMAAFIVSREAGFTTGFTFDLTGGRAVY